jgi:hypothetical protein
MAKKEKTTAYSILAIQEMDFPKVPFPRFNQFLNMSG